MPPFLLTQSEINRNDRTISLKANADGGESMGFVVGRLPNGVCFDDIGVDADTLPEE